MNDSMSSFDTLCSETLDVVLQIFAAKFREKALTVAIILPLDFIAVASIAIKLNLHFWNEAQELEQAQAQGPTQAHSKGSSSTKYLVRYLI